jgi:LysM repeat protein
MERVCPFLALAADARTVVGGYDADHRCHADGPPAAIERQRQLGLCLTDAHRDCELYIAAVKRHAATLAAPPPAPDAVLSRTRLLLEPNQMNGPLAGLRTGRLRRYGLAGAIAAVGVGAVVTGTAGGLGSLVGRDSPSPSATEVPATGSRLATPTPPLHASPDPMAGSPTASAMPAASQPVTAPSAPPSAEPSSAQIYVVRQGDTLSSIAEAFGVTVAAVMDANGLESDVINVGQQLVIP